MSSTNAAEFNGRVKKSLAFQLDRLDSILDGLAEALNGAVADAVRTAVGVAARGAVQQALRDAQASHATTAEAPLAAPPTAGFWHKVRAKVTSFTCKTKSVATSAWRRMRRTSYRWGTSVVLVLQAAAASVKSRALHLAVLAGAVASCCVNLWRHGSSPWRWGAGMAMCALLMVSVATAQFSPVLAGAACCLVALTARVERALIRVPPPAPATAEKSQPNHCCAQAIG